MQKTFVEGVEWKRQNVSYTERYERYIYQRVRRESVSRVAQDEGLSEEAVQGIFEYRAKTTEVRGYPQVRAICFDEISLHRGHGKFVLVISAPELGLVLDILPDRNKETLLKWLEERGGEWCAAVQYACPDMWDAYQQAAEQKLPNARRAADRFHIMKDLDDALTKARRIIQKDADEKTKELLKGAAVGYWPKTART